MFTVCPKCTLTLAVTAGDLRIGQGYVRCGRCLNVFNALLTLSDEPADSASLPQSSHFDPASRAQHDGPFGDATDEFEIAPETPAQVSPADGPPNHLLTESSSDGSIENESSLADTTGTFETIVLEGDGYTQTEEFVPDESVDSELAALTQRLGAADNEPIGVPVNWRNAGSGPAHFSEVAAQMFGQDASGQDASGENGYGQDASARHSSRRTASAAEQLDAQSEAASDTLDVSAAHDAPSARDTAAAPDASDAPDAPELLTASSARASQRLWPWIAGCTVLAALFALQAMNHWRDAIAASPLWNAPVSRVYAAINVPLDPHWNLAAYDVRQQGAIADPADAHVILVRLSLANRAARAQPVPLLRLTLLDRYGKRIAARDLTPAEYWPKGRPARAFLARDERIDSQVAVRDPADSASFELDVCLQNARGAVRCAGDIAPTASSGVP
jgi:predicted Zn finger-like uncharacterized protein